MSNRPGAARLGGIAALTVGLGLGLPGAALAGPDKQPDRTPNDHPSGKDRSEEPGGKTQGKSTSDPDGMTNGGADKPGGSGGFDADKDGNNGCGNDDDFEDDNNGNCGGLRKGKGKGTGGGEEGEVGGAGAGGGTTANQGRHLGQLKHMETGGSTTFVGETSVKSVSAVRTAKGGIGSLRIAGELDTPAQVLGVQFTRNGANQSNAVTRVLGSSTARTLATSGTGVAGLAATGMPVAALAMLGTALVGTGAFLVTRGRRED